MGTQASSPSTTTAPWSVDIPIPLGAHVITVKAQDTVGNAASVPTSITVQASAGAGPTETGVHLTYDFENFFHPFVGDLIKKLNEDSLAGMMNPNWLDGLKTPDPVTQQQDDFFFKTYGPVTNAEISVTSYRKQIELGTGEPYSNYNWELFFHVPLTVATHLSKTQRFAEAQSWFHYIFDPTSNDQTTEPPKRFWKFLGFRSDTLNTQIDQSLVLLAGPRQTFPMRKNDSGRTCSTGTRRYSIIPFNRTRWLARGLSLTSTT